MDFITGLVTATLETGTNDTFQLIVILIGAAIALINKLVFHNKNPKLKRFGSWMDFFRRKETKTEFELPQERDQKDTDEEIQTTGWEK